MNPLAYLCHIVIGLDQSEGVHAKDEAGVTRATLLSQCGVDCYNALVG